jgi:hypothetical protein
MYGIKNANYCMSILIENYRTLGNHLKDEYGPGTQCGEALYGSKTGNWYWENEDGVVTLYFPNKSDLDVVEKLKTFSVLDR